MDNRGCVRSLPPYFVAVPYVRERFNHDRTRVAAWFLRCRRDLWFIDALREEMQRCLAWQPSAQPHPDAMIEAAMRAIADGLIGVASMLPDDITLRFDELRPTEWDPLRIVAFADQAVADRFVAAMLDTRTGAAACETALLGPEGRRFAGLSLGVATSGSDSRAPAGSTTLAARISALLAQRILAAVPHDPSPHTLRLAWMERLPPSMVASSAPTSAGPSQRTPPPPPPSMPVAPASTLPDAPDDVSPQAQTLIDAARDGVPFCEECARAALASADA